jgi:hypothetical protein
MLPVSGFWYLAYEGAISDYQPADVMFDGGYKAGQRTRRDTL